VTLRPTPFEECWAEGALEDLQGLDASDTSVGDAELEAVDDVLHHRKRGKALGERNVSGDLSGLYRVKFDTPGSAVERYRFLYGLEGSTVTVWGFGPRRNHAVYKLIVARRQTD